MPDALWPDAMLIVELDGGQITARRLSALAARSVEIGHRTALRSN